MSNTQFAFINRAQVPDRSALQASIDALGFDLKLHPDFMPFEDSGFLPFILHGEEGPGFEIEYQDAAEVIDGDEELGAIAGGRDHCISMVWRSSMKDLACVMIVSCALAKDFDAVVSYEGDEPEPLAKMLEATHEIIRDAASEA
ncbi:MAG: hypothetical protein PHF20_07520 [Halothiobacillaceae bacterium]|nr:hypothetical protein [Halothiobacillaceae bacterium]